LVGGLVYFQQNNSGSKTNQTMDNSKIAQDQAETSQATYTNLSPKEAYELINNTPT